MTIWRPDFKTFKSVGLRVRIFVEEYGPGAILMLVTLAGMALAGAITGR